MNNLLHSVESFISDLEKFPPFLRPKDLVETGLFKSTTDVCWAMKRNQAPPSIKLSSHKVVFSKAALCEWLKKKASTVDFEGDHIDVDQS